MEKIKVLLAGSTHNAMLCAESLRGNDSFQITGVLTPSPKPVGRKQLTKENPLHEWALTNKVPVTTLQKKINEEIRSQLGTNRPDILLVVDFGYIVPAWLLELPKIGPVNIHPSDLPKYRGSSPGQFALMLGEKQSAITLIQMDEKLDHGPIISKIYFDIASDWTAKEYYAHAFDLVSQQLPSLLLEYCKHPKTVSAQPDDGIPPLARMLTRDDGFVPVATIKSILDNKKVEIPIPLLASYQLETDAIHLYSLWRGLTPWPGIWTKISLKDKEVRVKILEIQFSEDKLLLKRIQVEGKLPTDNVRILFQ